MKVKVIPGYNSLFGESDKSYEDIVKDIPSDIVIRLLISLNAELNTSEDHNIRQRRLLGFLISRFNRDQFLALSNGIENYKEKVPEYDGTLFARRYLLKMVSKELLRNNKAKANLNDPIHEFNFLLGYLKVIDEVHNLNKRLEDKIEINKGDGINVLKYIWSGLLDQYEFNEIANGAFEFYRTVCFFSYALSELRPYLKELMGKNGFTTIGDFIGSFSQLIMPRLKVNNDSILKKLYYIQPTKNYGIEHLDNLCINKYSGNELVNLGLIKKYPMYRTEDRGYMVLDENSLTRKIYIGPLFEIFYLTSLKENLESKSSNKAQAFGSYKTKVSNDAFEKLCFRGIIQASKIKKEDILYFDDNEDGMPDMYFRSGKKIILIELKDNLFPEAISSNSDEEYLLRFIEERLVENQKNKKKGVRQILDNITSLGNGHYVFDSGLKKMIANKEKLEITCILCYSDFMFSMPGINEYLNYRFKQIVLEKNLKVCVNKVTLVNLQTLFHYIHSGKNLVDFSLLIKRYWKIIDNRRNFFQKNSNAESFIKSKASFEEVYDSIFLKDQSKDTDIKLKNRVSDMLQSVGIDDSIFKIIV